MFRSVAGNRRGDDFLAAGDVEGPFLRRVVIDDALEVGHVADRLARHRGDDRTLDDALLGVGTARLDADHHQSADRPLGGSEVPLAGDRPQQHPAPPEAARLAGDGGAGQLAPAEHDLGGPQLVLAVVVERDGSADRGRADGPNKVVAVVDRLAVELHDDIALAQVGGSGRRVLVDRLDERADLLVDPRRLALAGGWAARLDAQVAVDHLAPLLEVLDDLHEPAAHRNGEADAVGLLLRENDGGVDADDVAPQVEQGAAGVARVDLGGGLNQVAVEPVFLAGELGERSAGGADNSDAHAHVAGDAQAVGVAQGNGPLAAPDRAGVAELHRG